jgi:hypothetical protein
MIRPYVEELFSAAGAKSARSDEIGCRLDGRPACSYWIRWDADVD